MEFGNSNFGEPNFVVLLEMCSCYYKMKLAMFCSKIIGYDLCLLIMFKK